MHTYLKITPLLILLTFIPASLCPADIVHALAPKAPAQRGIVRIDERVVERPEDSEPEPEYQRQATEPKVSRKKMIISTVLVSTVILVLSAIGVYRYEIHQSLPLLIGSLMSFLAFGMYLGFLATSIFSKPEVWQAITDRWNNNQYLIIGPMLAIITYLLSIMGFTVFLNQAVVDLVGLAPYPKIFFLTSVGVLLGTLSYPVILSDRNILGRAIRSTAISAAYFVGILSAFGMMYFYLHQSQLVLILSMLYFLGLGGFFGYLTIHSISSSRAAGGLGGTYTGLLMVIVIFYAGIANVFKELGGISHVFYHPEVLTFDNWAGLASFIQLFEFLVGVVLAGPVMFLCMLFDDLVMWKIVYPRRHRKARAEEKDNTSWEPPFAEPDMPAADFAP